MKTLSNLFFLGALTLTLPACVKLFGVAPTLKVAFLGEPNSLDPVMAEGSAAAAVLELLQRPLVQRGADKKPTPDLAQSWSVNDEGRTLRFALAATYWSDGVEVRAQDFVFAWQRHLAPESKSAALPTLLKLRGARGYHLGETKNFESVGVRAPNDKTLEVELEKAEPEFITLLTSPLLSPQREDVSLKHPKDFASPLHLRTTGAYQPVSWTPGKTLSLALNSYFPVRPDIQKIDLEFSYNGQSAQSALSSGEIYMVWAPPNSFELGNRLAPQTEQQEVLVRFVNLRWR